jgi:RNA polymerase sigma factor (sigma-70 family)
VNRSPYTIPALAHRLAQEAALHSTDAALLRRFAESRDGDAFEALVVRHGPMVFDVCRGILGGQADAEDAFQATFLVLARRAADIRDPDGLARWLFGVATRTARKARLAARRQRLREIATPPMQPAAPIDPSWSEVQAIVRDELFRMAERYSLPLTLCYLQGRTQDEAATLLSLSKGTLRRRLERGRVILRERLVRRGLGPAAVLIAAALPTSTVFAAVPPALVESTTFAAIKFAAGDSSAVSSTVSSLAHGVVSAMHLTKLTSTVCTAVFFLALVAAGAWRFGARADDGPKPSVPVASSLPRTMGKVDPEPKDNRVPKNEAPKDGLRQPKPERKEGEPPPAVPTITPRPSTPAPRREKKDDMLTAQITLNDHGIRNTQRIYSAGIELENLSGHAATVNFDPKDLKLELLDTEGKVIAEADTVVRSGPIPIAHKATIPTSGYVGFSTYRGGVVAGGQILFAPGWQVWGLKPGTYRLRGKVTVTTHFGDDVLDPGKPELPDAERREGRVTLELAERQFELNKAP